MFFKSTRHFLSVVVCSSFFLLQGCDFFLDRQSPPAEEQVELKTAATTCLKQMPDRLARFFSDSVAPNEVNEAFRCLNTTLEHFQKFTRGSVNPTQYTDEELRTFLNDDLTTERRISPKFMREIMKVKTALLGGTDRVITRAEIAQTQVLLGVLENELQSLRGKMRLLLFQAPRAEVGQEQLRSAQRQLELSVAKILEVSKAESTTYSFADLESFMAEVNQFVDSNEMFEEVVRWMPLAEKIKVLFWGERTLGEQTQRNEVLGWSVRCYGMVLQYVYWIKNLSLDRPEDMDKLIEFGDSLFDLVEDSPALRQKSVLSVSAMERILEAVLQEGLFQTSIPLPVIEESFRMAVSTMVEGPAANRRHPFEVEVLTTRHIATLRFEWNAWVVAQKQTNRVFSQLDDVRLEDFRRVLTDDLALAEADKRPSLKPGEAEALRQTLKEWSGLMNLPHPILWNERERLILAHDLGIYRLGFNGMTKAAMLRTFTRFVMRGYGTGTVKNVWDLKIKTESFELFEEDFRQFGRHIYALDPRTPSPAARTFQEANFFSFSGDGNDVLTSAELFEEFNILTSAGGMISSEVADMGVAGNCAIEDRDVFGRQYLKTDCFQRLFRVHFLDTFSSAPGLQALYMSMIGRRDQENFYKDLWALGLADYSRPGLTEYADLRTSITVLHYIEILRLAYDKDRNMKLSQQEIEAAAPRFHRFIADRSPLGENMVKEVFVCLVFEQRKPGGDFDTGRCLVQQRFNYEPVGPAELVKVMAVLKDDLSADEAAEKTQIPSALSPGAPSALSSRAPSALSPRLRQ